MDLCILVEGGYDPLKCQYWWVYEWMGETLTVIVDEYEAYEITKYSINDWCKLIISDSGFTMSFLQAMTRG